MLEMGSFLGYVFRIRVVFRLGRLQPQESNQDLMPLNVYLASKSSNMRHSKKLSKENVKPPKQNV